MEPLWYKVAEKQIGVREIPGPRSEPKIMAWAKAVGSRLGMTYANDDTPWCGLFTAYCVQAAGLKPPAIAVRAKAWASWGDRLEEPTVGAVLVFERAGGGHVGFYAGETNAAYRVLGGNQGNAVNYAWLAKDRCIAIRWPAGVPRIPSFKIVGFKASDALSLNEA